MERKRNDPLLRAAIQVHKQLVAAPRSNDQPNCSLEMLLAAQQRLEQISRHLQLARRYGLNLAAQRLQQTLQEQVRSLNRLTSQFPGSESNPLRQPLSLRTLLSDLRQLNQEFEHVNFDLKHRRISVTTDSITLEGIELGRFTIELHAARLDRISSSVFDCVAMDPNPASSSEATTHPHVRDDGLCAGDAGAAIANALKDGRITDAFCLVKAVLQTYNPQSPYIALEDWDGVRCPGCDVSVDRDDLYSCDGCQSDFCEDCISRCDVCDSSHCPDCLENDPVSDRRCCSQCRDTCVNCGRIVDADSFVQESGCCPGCEEVRREQNQLKENEHEHEQETAEPIAATT